MLRPSPPCRELVVPGESSSHDERWHHLSATRRVVMARRRGSARAGRNRPRGRPTGKGACPGTSPALVEPAVAGLDVVVVAWDLERPLRPQLVFGPASIVALRAADRAWKGPGRCLGLRSRPARGAVVPLQDQNREYVTAGPARERITALTEGVWRRARVVRAPGHSRLWRGNGSRLRLPGLGFRASSGMASAVRLGSALLAQVGWEAQ
jgi:hypothetical protein